MQVQVNLSTQCRKWLLHPEINIQVVNDILNLTLAQFNSLQKLQILNVSIVLTNNSYMRTLNNKYLHKNKPTNVLSFPQFAFDQQTLTNFKSTKEVIFLGDVLFGYQVLSKEAKYFSISLLEHFAHLLIHGTLHLLGFDHQLETEAHVMESLEKDTLLKFLKVSKI
jgi:probable rRNA maturation factor